jgi:hypothetical protein
MIQLRFKHDGNNYKAEYEEKGENYFVKNIRLDFEDIIGDMPLRSMVIHLVVHDDDVLWIDENGQTNEFIKIVGQAIEDHEMQ